MEDIKVVNLKPQRIEAVIKMVVKRFLFLNQYWKEQKYEESNLCSGSESSLFSTFLDIQGQEDNRSSHSVLVA